MDRELLDAEMIAGHLVPPGSVFAFLAEHRSELFPDSFTADLFPSRTGRPSLPADLVGSVLVLKELYDLSDPQTADALKYDIRWKVACGRSLTQVSFDASTLVYWRKRIAKSGRLAGGMCLVVFIEVVQLQLTLLQGAFSDLALG
jgi:transposase